MAMPQDFWRNAQSLNIFRTKPCQRLAQEGFCSWKSQCQYSHCIDWPRRQPLKHSYSPMLCPNVRQCLLAENGPIPLDKACPAGLRCPMAHSQEEILLHPDIFKTTLCEEYDGVHQSAKPSKRHWCHRYYCPHAHGSQELRSSSLTEEMRSACLQSAELFQTDTCCKTCAPSWNTRMCSTGPFKTNASAQGYYMDGTCGDCSMPWPSAGTPPFMSSSFWPMPPDNTDQVPFTGWPREKFEAETTDTNGFAYSLPPSALGETTKDSSKAWPELKAPVFIDVGKDGKMTVGPRKVVKPKVQSSEQQMQALASRVYAEI